MKKLLAIFLQLVLFLPLFSHTSPQVIQTQLDQAKKDFEIAKRMFSPWYGGTLLTGSGNVMPPKYVNINPTLQITDNYAAFDSSGKANSSPDLFNVTPSLGLGFGLVNRLDLSFAIVGVYQEQQGNSYFNISDFPIQISLGILKEQEHVPAFKLYIKEIFPIGKYNNLDPSKANVEAVGNGSYQTEVGVGLSKVVWWWLTHPMQFRFVSNYRFYSNVDVKNYNAYGGGNNTEGTISPGNKFAASFGYEFSVTQKFVLALDLVYEHHNKTTFTGTQGTLADGSLATNGGPSNYVFSAAPAIEFVFTPDIVLATGVWFAISGRNTADFIAGIVSFTYGF